MTAKGTTSDVLDALLHAFAALALFGLVMTVVVVDRRARRPTGVHGDVRAVPHDRPHR